MKTYDIEDDKDYECLGCDSDDCMDCCPHCQRDHGICLDCGDEEEFEARVDWVMDTRDGK